MQIKTTMRDFPGGPVVKNPPSNSGDTGSIPDQGTKIPQAMGRLSPCATTTEPAHSGACAATGEKTTHHNKEPECRYERSRVPQLRPTQPNKLINF